MINVAEGFGRAARLRHRCHRLRHRHRFAIGFLAFVFPAAALLALPSLRASAAAGTLTEGRSDQPIQTPLAPTRVLTLDEAMARAEAASGLVRRARADRRVVAARSVGADVPLPGNPLLAVSAGPRREDNPTGGRSEGTAYALHLEQAVEIAGQRSTRRAEVARMVDVAAWREAAALAEVRARVRATYVGAQLSDAQVRAARRRLELVEQLVDSVRTRVDAGAASNVDLQLARIEKGRAVRERVAAELSLALGLSELRALIGLPAGDGIALTPEIGQPPAAPPLGGLITQARLRRNELRVLAASHDEVDATIVRLRREVVPSPTFFLDLQRDLPGQLYLGGGLALPLPVWRRNQGELAVARAERERLDADTSVTEREIDAEVERAYHGLAANAQIVAAVERDVLPAAESAVELITQGWRAGKFDLFRVIQASREASEARRNQLESLGALWQAAIAVDRATGTP